MEMPHRCLRAAKAHIKYSAGGRERKHRDERLESDNTSTELRSTKGGDFRKHFTKSKCHFLREGRVRSKTGSKLSNKEKEEESTYFKGGTSRTSDGQTDGRGFCSPVWWQPELHETLTV